MAKRTSKVKNLGGLWNKARETTSSDSSGDFVPVEPGTYVMQLASCEAQTFKEQRKLWWKWIVIQAENEDDLGKVCHDFEGIDDDERLVWVQRHLVALGVDLDSREIEDEDDLLATYGELIEDNCCARVKVTEKDGWTNLRVQKRIEVDEDDLVDPETALEASNASGKSQRSQDGARNGSVDDGDDGDDGEVDGDEEAVDVGTRVTWEDGERAGEITAFTDDEESAIIKEDGKRKKATVSLEDLEIEGSDDSDEADDDEGDDETEYAFNEGDAVLGDFDDETYEGTVTGSGNEAVEVDFGDGPEMVKTSDCDLRLASDEEDEDEDADEDETEDEAEEFDKGDAVLFKVRGRDKSGTVVSVNKSKGTVRVKDANDKVHTIAVDDLDFDVD